MRTPLLLVWLALAVAARGAELTLRIEPRWGAAPLAVEGAAVAQVNGQALRVTRLAALVSGVVLHRADGGSVRLEGRYGLIDAGRGRTEIALGDVPAGDYAGLEFCVGLPPAVNHGDVAQWPARHPLNPLVNGLHWSWQGGYVFLALEGRWTHAGGERSFLYHLATEAHAMPVRFVAPLRIARDSGVQVNLALDVARVLRDIRLAPDDGSESTHSGEGDAVAATLAAAVSRAWFWLSAESRASTAFAAAAATGSAPPTVAGAGATARPWAFAVPAGFPQPELPSDNPLTEEGVALGRALFFDPRLSSNGTQSCASCHAPERAFSDEVALSRGAEGGIGARNAMPLFNLAWHPAYAWDGGKARVRDQALAAMTNPIEMNAEPARVVAALAADAAARAGFAAAFGDGAVTAERIGLVLEQYLLTIVHADSTFDRALRGAAELSAEEKRGFELFMTEYDPARGRRGADCFHCHGGPLFSDFGYKNNGLEARPRDAGREAASGVAADRGKFKTPSLRNVALTGPYLHDGRAATLEEVVAHYDHGVVRSPTLDPNLAKHPSAGLALTAEDQRALVAFLRTLTESSLTGRDGKSAAGAQ